MAITKRSHIARKGVPAMADEERLRLLELACAKHASWLTHCGGKGVEISSSRGYASRHLGSFREVHGAGVRVCVVEGSDVFTRYRQGPEAAQLMVIVSREGERGAAQTMRLQMSSDVKARIHVLPPAAGSAEGGDELSAASSTRVRALVASGERAALERMCGEEVAESLLRDAAR